MRPNRILHCGSVFTIDGKGYLVASRELYPDIICYLGSHVSSLRVF